MKVKLTVLCLKIKETVAKPNVELMEDTKAETAVKIMQVKKIENPKVKIATNKSKELFE